MPEMLPPWQSIRVTARPVADFFRRWYGARRWMRAGTVWWIIQSADYLAERQMGRSTSPLPATDQTTLRATAAGCLETSSACGVLPIPGSPPMSTIRPWTYASIGQRRIELCKLAPAPDEGTKCD